MAEDLPSQGAVAWTRSVARINVGGYRGTGFLVSEVGLVLTAFHVVGDLKESRKKGQAVFYPMPIKVRFGDGKKVTRDGGFADVVTNRYSFEEDWVLLRIQDPGRLYDANDGDIAPLRPLKLASPPAGERFESFGFPTKEADNGGEYRGTFGLWEEPSRGTIEVAIDGMAPGMDMSGISGAPCVYQGQVVAMILQQLADAKGMAVKPSLYVVPIERAMRGCEGIAWDDGGRMLFQEEVAANLPDSPGALQRIGVRLARPHVATRDLVARRLLSSEFPVATPALVAGKLKPEQSREIIDCLAAMHLHDDSVEGLRRAFTARRPALLVSKHREVHAWYLRRARAPASFSVKRMVVLRGRPGDEEPAVGSVVEELVAQVRKQLERRGVHRQLREGMLGTETNKDRVFWVILIDESRPEVLDALRRCLPNAHVIAGTSVELQDVAVYGELVDVVTPKMTEGEESALVEAWASAALDLDVTLEEEADS